MSNELKKRAKELSEQGQTLKEISLKIGMSPSTIKRWKKENFIDKKNIKMDQVEKIKKEELKQELTEQQLIFCSNYALTMNIYTSAINAGYSESYATSGIYTMIKQPLIIEKINELKKLMIQDINPLDILEYHKKVLYDRDIEKFVDFEKRELKPNIDKKMIKKITMKDTEFGRDISVEMVDFKQSLDFMTKYYGLDPSFINQNKKVEIEVAKNDLKPNGVGVESMTEEELDNLLKKYAGATKQDYSYAEVTTNKQPNSCVGNLTYEDKINFLKKYAGATEQDYSYTKENVNKHPTATAHDMTIEEQINILKKYGGA